MKSIIKCPLFIIDSGVGGLFLYKTLKQHLPFERLYYLADNQFFPYGNKNKEQLEKRATALLTKVQTFSPKLILIACNSLSFCMQEKNSSIISTNFAIDALMAKFPNAKILATSISSKIIPQTIGFESLATQIEFHQEISIEQFQPLQQSSSQTYILGCTHYSWIQNYLNQHLPTHQFIDPTKLIIQRIIQVLQQKRLFNSGQTIEKDHFFSTSNQMDFLQRAKKWVDLETVEEFLI